MNKITKTLSIVIITMNRADQLVEAIEGCLSSRIPEDSEIIIIDNGSTDNTEFEISRISKNSKIPIDFYKLEENVGIAEGRNIGYRKAKGKYVYNMDDDSVINPEYYNSFFVDIIKYMKENPQIATLTTEVFDECLGEWRHSKKAKSFKNDYPLIYAFHGNTYFIRKDIDGLEFVPTIKYGYEDVYASIVSLDKGYINALYDKVSTIHKPKFNKWAKGSQSYIEVLIKGTAGMMTVKYLLYPKIFIPLLYVGFFMRWFKHSRYYKGTLSKSYQLFRNQTKGIKVQKISWKTVYKIFKEFGFAATV